MKKNYLLFILLLCLFPTVKAQFHSGNGTAQNPYEILLPEHLNNLLKNENNCNRGGVYFALIGNISMEDAVTGENGWIIGTEPFRFKGHFDGRGNVISGIWKKDTNNYVGGLFAVLEAGGSIKKLGIKIDNRGIEGKYFAGGIVGINDGTISECYATGGHVSSAYRSIGVGGITGKNSGTVVNCWADCIIKGDNHILYHSSVPPALGGIVGINERKLNTSYCRSEVSSFYGGGAFTGLLLGSISDSYYDATITKLSPVGNWRDAYINYVKGRETAEMKKYSSFNFDFDSVWKLVEDCSFPILKWEDGYPSECVWCFPKGAGTSEEPFEIETAEQLDCIRNHLAAGNKSYHYILLNDIDLETFIAEKYPEKGWLPIGGTNINFDGVLNGNGKIISGFWINRSDESYAGLFVSIGPKGRIENLGLEVKNDKSVIGRSVVGGIAIRNYGTVEGCFVSGHIQSGGTAGGLIAVNNGYGTIKNCYSMGKISGGTVGGLVGNNNIEGKIYYCYTNAEINGINSRGLTGISSGTIRYSYHDGNVAGIIESGVSKNTAEMKTRNTYVNWDFENTWKIMEKGNYPLLAWQACNRSVQFTGPLEVTNDLTGFQYEAPVGFGNYTWIINGGVILSTSEAGRKVTVKWLSLGRHSLSVNYEDINGCFSFAAPLQYVEVTNANRSCFAVGNGTAYSPYEISTIEDFECMREYISSGAHFKLVKDIDLGGINWLPIGTSFEPFNGTFDGRGYTISGLKIQNNGDSIGFFGVSEGTIKNLFLKSTNTVISGNNCVGGLVGVNKGTIYNCHVTASLNGSSFIGGVAGLNEGRIELSGTNVKISAATGYAIGGLVGFNSFEKRRQGYIGSCYSNSEIYANEYIGGLVGINSGNIEASFTIAHIMGKTFIGGLVGYNYGLNNLSNHDLSFFSVRNSYSMGVIYGLPECDFIGGLIGLHQNLPVANCYSTCKVIAAENYYIHSLVGGIGMRSVNSRYNRPLYECVYDYDYSSFEGDSYNYSVGGPRGALASPDFYRHNFGSWTFENDPWKFSYYCQNTPYLRWQENMTWYKVMYVPGFTNGFLMPYLEGYMRFIYNDCYLHNVYYYPYEGYYDDDNYYGAPQNPNVNDTISIKDNISEKKEVIIYPNPTTGIIQIETEEISPEIKVFDVKGVQLIKTKEKTIDLSGYPSGVYFVAIRGKVTKVIKQ